MNHIVQLKTSWKQQVICTRTVLECHKGKLTSHMMELKHTSTPQHTNTECIHRECIHRECIQTECIHTECIHTECIHTECIHTECLHTECIHKSPT